MVWPTSDRGRRKNRTECTCMMIQACNVADIIMLAYGCSSVDMRQALAQPAAVAVSIAVN